MHGGIVDQILYSVFDKMINFFYDCNTSNFLKLNISTTRSGNHALILVFCLFVTVLFYLTHNTSENISYSLETNEMHIIIFDYDLWCFWNGLRQRKFQTFRIPDFLLQRSQEKLLSFLSLMLFLLQPIHFYRCVNHFCYLRVLWGRWKGINI